MRSSAVSMVAALALALSGAALLGGRGAAAPSRAQAFIAAASHAQAAPPPGAFVRGHHGRRRSHDVAHNLRMMPVPDFMLAPQSGSARADEAAPPALTGNRAPPDHPPA